MIRLAWRYNKHDQFIFIHTRDKEELTGVQGKFNPIGKLEESDKTGNIYIYIYIYTYICIHKHVYA